MKNGVRKETVETIIQKNFVGCTSLYLIAFPIVSVYIKQRIIEFFLFMQRIVHFIKNKIRRRVLLCNAFAFHFIIV